MVFPREMFSIRLSAPEPRRKYERGERGTRENFSFPIPAKPEPDKFNYNFATLLNQFIEFGTRSTNRDGPYKLSIYLCN